MPALPSWLVNPLWDQFAALLPTRPVFDPSHPLGCHRRRIADASCSAGTIRNRRDEWITLGVFAQLKTTALDAYDRIVGLLLERSHHQSPGGGEVAGPSPIDANKA